MESLPRELDQNSIQNLEVVFSDLQEDNLNIFSSPERFQSSPGYNAAEWQSVIEEPCNAIFKRKHFEKLSRILEAKIREKDS